MAANGTLIEIEDLTKIFYTDEVETHALSGVHLKIERGEYVAMSGPSGVSPGAGARTARSPWPSCSLARQAGGPPQASAYSMSSR